MPYLDFTANLRQFLHNWISAFAMRTLKIFTCLLEYLLEKDQPANIVVFNLPHLQDVTFQLFTVQHYVVAIFADHLQDQNEVLEIADMINGKV